MKTPSSDGDEEKKIENTAKWWGWTLEKDEEWDWVGREGMRGCKLMAVLLFFHLSRSSDGERNVLRGKKGKERKAKSGKRKTREGECEKIRSKRIIRGVCHSSLMSLLDLSSLSNFKVDFSINTLETKVWKSLEFFLTLSTNNVTRRKIMRRAMKKH